MINTFDAIYENGVFRPLQPVALAENQRVRLTVQANADGATGDDDLIDHAFLALHTKRQAEAPSLEQVRAMLRGISATANELIDIERDEQ